HARGCADAAMYSAKAAGGNHILVYDPDRDGVPEPDGTRPLRRRRDIDPLAADGVAWLPTPADDLVPLLLPAADLRTIHHVLTTAAASHRQLTALHQTRGSRCNPLHRARTSATCTGQCSAPSASRAATTRPSSSSSSTAVSPPHASPTPRCSSMSGPSTARPNRA